MQALEGLELTADFYPTLSLRRGNKQDRGKYQEGRRTAKCEEAMEVSESQKTARQTKEPLEM